jgi:large subunit ribosomal protein L9
MKIILLKDVENLGEEGEVKTVTDGYGRNFLLPRGFATLFSKAGLNLIEQRQAKIEARKEVKRQAALGLKEKLQGLNLVISMPAGDNGKLFGAVTNGVVAEHVAKAAGVAIDKRHVSIHGNAIKLVGVYDVRIRVMDREYANIKVEVKALEA